MPVEMQATIPWVERLGVDRNDQLCQNPDHYPLCKPECKFTQADAQFYQEMRGGGTPEGVDRALSMALEADMTCPPMGPDFKKITGWCHNVFEGDFPLCP